MSREGGVASPLVLVVEDDTDTRELLGFLLDIGGFEVVLARTGEEALQLAGERTPALITIDIGLPGINGLEVARRVRQNPATRSVPMIAVTGWVAQQDVARAKEAGCDVVLSKPCPPETLHAEILRLLSPTL
jgi:two-component system, cell cycle response regulator DivK